MFGKTSKQFFIVALAGIAVGGMTIDAGAKSLCTRMKTASKAKENLVVSETSSPIINSQASNLPSSEEVIASDVNEKQTLNKEINRSDDEISESLGKITQFENLKSSNTKISRLYSQHLKSEKKNLSEKERELSGALKLKEEFELE